MDLEEDKYHMFPLWLEILITILVTGGYILLFKPSTIIVFVVWWIIWEVSIYVLTRDGMAFAKNYKYVWWRRLSIISSSFVTYFLVKHFVKNK